jgi:nitrile hydratase subunit beta
MSYNTHADLGGQNGHGRVVPEPEGELWHAAWEPRAMALTLACGATGSWNIDMSRSARETLPDYAALSYYQIWTAALEKLLIERRMLRRAELRKATAIDPPIPVARLLRAENVAAALARGSPTERPSVEAARFAVGDRVRTRKLKVSHHTRLPGYVQGQVGSIERVHGMHVFADPHAHGLGEQPQWLYTVVFDAGQLWPGSGPGSHSVSVDAWQPYLEPAGVDA